FLYDPDTEALVALGVSDTPMARRQTQAGLHRLPLANGGRAAEVFLSGQPYFSRHVEADADELLDIREAVGVRSAIIAPVDVAGKRRGVLVANSAQPEHFAEEDLDFWKVVARWVGMIAHRAELAEENARLAEERGRLRAYQDLIGRLTAREQEVAALVALGLTNAEIGARLRITEGTAGNHVRSILHKIGAASRVQIAAIMAHLSTEPQLLRRG
ncbi:MAG TPA: LuxR C-terminal-related transcriptional regulator, partial [Chloroflexota bacterium]|nr:LuxR C-terminal-related transcriptional regulator [Chloroflexota bacterium]